MIDQATVPGGVALVLWAMLALLIVTGRAAFIAGLVFAALLIVGGAAVLVGLTRTGRGRRAPARVATPGGHGSPPGRH